MLKITQSLSLILIIILIVGLAALDPVNAAWSTATNLSNDGNANDLPSIAQVQNGDVWVVWRSKKGWPTYDLYYKVYNRTSGTWPAGTGTRLRSCSTAGVDSNPFVMQTSDGALWVLWSTNDARSNYDIVSRKSYDYGSTWNSFNNVTLDGKQVGGYSDYSPAALQASNGTIWVIWQKQINSTISQIYYKTAPASGSPWSLEAPITSSLKRRNGPAIAQAKNGSIIAFWTEEVYGIATSYELKYRVSNGYSWGPEKQLTNDGPTGLDDFHPSAILTRNGSIWVVWEQSDASAKSNIVYVHSGDNGNSWSPIIPITSTNTDMWPSATQGSDKKVWIAFSSDRALADSNDVYSQTSDQLLYHDVAVTDIRLSDSWVYRGWSVSATVDVKNKGDYSETLTTRLYANNTLIGTNTTVLSSGSSASIVFPWYTSSFAFGNYVMHATVDSVPNENTINLYDNTLTRGSMMLRIPGDVNGDAQVNTVDLNMLESAFGSASGQPAWDYACDINRNGVVDTTDLFLLGSNYGRTA